jgi:hypothetical protein
MKRLAVLVTVCAFTGCVLASNDLVSQGAYRTEVAETYDGSLRLTVREEDGKLIVEGRYRGVAGRGPTAPDVEVSLVAPDGSVIGRTQASFVHHSQKRMSHDHFRADFVVLPPDGTRIRIRPLAIKRGATPPTAGPLNRAEENNATRTSASAEAAPETSPCESPAGANASTSGSPKTSSPIRSPSSAGASEPKAHRGGHAPVVPPA